MQSSIDYYEKSREEKFHEWWRRYGAILSSPKYRHYITDISKKDPDLLHFSWSFLFPGQSPLTLNWSMFIQAVDMFGTEEQKAHFLPQMDALRIIGCYA